MIILKGEGVALHIFDYYCVFIIYRFKKSFKQSMAEVNKYNLELMMLWMKKGLEEDINIFRD